MFWDVQTGETSSVSYEESIKEKRLPFTLVVALPWERT